MSYKGKKNPFRKIELLITPSGALAVLCPYDAKFVEAAKVLEGKFGYIFRGGATERAWFFSLDKEIAVGELLRSVFNFPDQEFLSLAEERVLLLMRIKEINVLLDGKNCVAKEMDRIFRPRFRILNCKDGVEIHDSLRDKD